MWHRRGGREGHRECGMQLWGIENRQRGRKGSRNVVMVNWEGIQRKTRHWQCGYGALTGGIQGSKAVRMWLRSIGEGVERAHGWSNSVVGHSRHGSAGNMAVGMGRGILGRGTEENKAAVKWLCSIDMGWRGEQDRGLVVMEHRIADNL